MLKFNVGYRPCTEERAYGKSQAWDESPRDLEDQKDSSECNRQSQNTTRRCDCDTSRRRQHHCKRHLVWCGRNHQTEISGGR